MQFVVPSTQDSLNHGVAVRAAAPLSEFSDLQAEIRIQRAFPFLPREAFSDLLPA